MSTDIHWLDGLDEPQPDPACVVRDKAICSMDKRLLMNVVMTLTGGSANPNVVEGQIDRIRAYYADAKTDR